MVRGRGGRSWLCSVPLFVIFFSAFSLPILQEEHPSVLQPPATVFLQLPLVRSPTHSVTNSHIPANVD